MSCIISSFILDIHVNMNLLLDIHHGGYYSSLFFSLPCRSKQHRIKLTNFSEVPKLLTVENFNRIFVVDIVLTDNVYSLGMKEC